jgi:GxxExxY protein
MLVFATNQIKHFAFGGIRRGGHQPSEKREFEMPIIYKGKEVGLRRVDFLVENIISVEIKALVTIEDVHLTQAINYLEAYNLQTGLLINFGARSLQFKRVFNKSWQS